MATHENNQDTEDFEHQPPVIRYATPILEQFVMAHSNIVSDILCVGVYSLNPLSLLSNHMR
jgi:hypothetical protein